MQVQFPNGFTAYDPERCAVLAYYHSARALMNADSYAWFAAAIFFDDWDFSTGVAVAVQ